MNWIVDRSWNDPIKSTIVCQHARQQTRAAVTPFDRVAELDRLFQTLLHDRMARREIHGPASNEVVVLSSKKFVDDRNAVSEAYNVGIDPLATLLSKKLVPEIV